LCLKSFQHARETHTEGKNAKEHFYSFLIKDPLLIKNMASLTTFPISLLPPKVKPNPVIQTMSNLKENGYRAKDVAEESP